MRGENITVVAQPDRFLHINDSEMYYDNFVNIYSICYFRIHSGLLAMIL